MVMASPLIVILAGALTRPECSGSWQGELDAKHAKGGADENGHLVFPRLSNLDQCAWGAQNKWSILWKSTYQGLVPLVDMEGAGTKACVLAGEAMEIIGRFKTVQNIQIIDFELQEKSTVSFDIGQ
jgi:hypothetical protein